MKKKLLLLGSMSLAVLNAHAQSSVTLYGLIDDGLNYVNNVQTVHDGHRAKASQTFLSTSILQGDRWGIRAVEDLGGGLKVLTVLESGFDLNTGKFQQGGAMFGRQIYVGLNNRFGTVTVGRQYDPLLEFVTVTTAGPWGGAYVAHVDDLDNLNNTFRVNNAIKISTEPYRGLNFGGMYSLGGVAGATTQNQQFALATSYANGPFYAAAVYQEARNPNLSVYGNTPSGGGATTNNIGATTLSGTQFNPALSGYASAHSKDILAVGMSYKIGQGTLAGNYTNVRFTGLGDLNSGPNPFGYHGTASFNTGELTYSHFVTPSLILAAGYVFTEGSGPNGTAKYHQPQTGFDYFLSKMTDVYGTFVFQKASGRDSTGQQAVASINGVTPSTSDKQILVRLGIRHKF